MKYVMFTHTKIGMRMPVFAPEKISHADIKAGAEWKATSAGYVFISKTTKCNGRSGSLDLDPADGDSELCNMVIIEVIDSMCFITQDIELNLVNLRKVAEARGEKRFIVQLEDKSTIYSYAKCRESVIVDNPSLASLRVERIEEMETLI